MSKRTVEDGVDMPPPTPVPAGVERAQGAGDVARRVREITRANQRLFGELLAGERRFRRLARAVWKVQEDERRRLARELHDGIGQTLTALKNQLEMAQRQQPERQAEGLAEAFELASQALDDTRELSRLLRPPVLDDLGLVPALRWLARTLRQRSGLAIELRNAGAPERLDPELETLIFRVVQEALTNAIKHSGAERAEVELRVEAGRLLLRVADSGDGFDTASALGPADDGTGVGLRGMEDRVELFGGRLRIDSRPGEGTVIEAQLPLSGDGEEQP